MDKSDSFSMNVKKSKTIYVEDLVNVLRELEEQATQTFTEEEIALTSYLLDAIQNYAYDKAHTTYEMNTSSQEYAI